MILKPGKMYAILSECVSRLHFYFEAQRLPQSNIMSFYHLVVLSWICIASFLKFSRSNSYVSQLHYMPHHLRLRIALGNFCQWLRDLVLRLTMTIISSSHSPWTLKFYGLHSIILTQVLVFPDWNVQPTESWHVIPFPCHLRWLNCTSRTSEQSLPPELGRPHIWDAHVPHVRLSIYTYSHPETQKEQLALVFTAFFIPNFFCFASLCSFQQTHSLPFLISFFEYPLL